MAARVLIIIPAHNESATLSRVINNIKRAVAADIVVVDDGSTDATAAIALAEGAELLQLPFNLGIGSAMQTGFRFAARQGYDIAVQTDGDGQHDASFIPRLIEPIKAGRCNLVVGSRYLSGNYRGSIGRRLGTAFFSRLLSLLMRQKVTDATSGFRAADRQLIRLFADDYPRDYPEVESLLSSHVAGLAVGEVAVEMRQREGGRSSINSFRSIYYMVKVLLAISVAFSRRRSGAAAGDAEADDADGTQARSQRSDAAAPEAEQEG